MADNSIVEQKGIGQALSDEERSYHKLGETQALSVSESIFAIKTKLYTRVSESLTQKLASDDLGMYREYSKPTRQEIKRIIQEKKMKLLHEWQQQLQQAKNQGHQEMEGFGNIDIAIQAINQLVVDFTKQK